MPSDSGGFRAREPVVLYTRAKPMRSLCWYSGFLFLTLAGVSAGVAQTFSFSETDIATPTNVGGGFAVTTVFDFNGDGIPDLVGISFAG
jgi:hypothetical protein